MPRLKLDIFSTETGPSEAARKEEPKITPVRDEEPPNPIHELATNAATKPESPKFIPVGFTGELAFLEEAVFRLRRNGHRQASKSAIIRALIVLHEKELERIYLESQDGREPTKAAPVNP